MPEGFEKPGLNSASIFDLLRVILFSGAMLLSLVAVAQPQKADSIKNIKTPDQVKQERGNLELYGCILTDVIHDFKQMDPKWYDVPRPTKLPSFKDKFAPDGQIYFSLRATRIGVKSFVPTPLGPLNTVEPEFKEGNSCTVDGKNFSCKQFHFHTPSEHLVDGITFPMEGMCRL